MIGRLRRSASTVPGWAFWAPLPFVSWSLFTLASGERRWELIVVMVVVPAFALMGPRTRTLLAGIYPLALVGVLYDAMRFVQYAGISASDVHVCDLRALEIRLFGVNVAGVRTTVHDWLQAHATTWLDIVCAVPYGTFLYACIALAFYLFRVDFVAMQRFAWTFLILNVAGFVTYHLYPAAPPWYFHAHGCAADLQAAASEGPNLARLDALLGVSYFKDFYGRSRDVFGAVPSLHIAYPLLMVREGWPHFRPWLRAFAVAYFLTMCFAAVYLDHHWVLDVLIGLFYALVVHGSVCLAFRLRGARSIAAAPTTPMGCQHGEAPARGEGDALWP